MIEIKDLNKFYNYNKTNEFQALNKVDLTIQDGEFVSIIGKSGAGKSTLLHILGGLEKFESGSYLFDKDKIERLNDKKLSALRGQKIGFVLQDFGLIPEETVLHNVCMPLYFDKTPLKKIKRLGLDALGLVGIKDLAKNMVKNLSGGQKQRVAIARAIVNSPSVILADEPTGALDTATTKEIMDVFENLNKNGKMVIIVTHEMQVAKRTKRIITISDGRIVEDKISE